MLQKGDRVGPYNLIKKLGHGTFGEAWLGEKRTEKGAAQFVIKLPNIEDVNVERLWKEAKLWRTVGEHPNISTIYEANMYADQIVVVKEFSQEGTLADYIKKNNGKATSIEEALQLIFGILNGLEHLHSKGIIHGDLKPSNIFMKNGKPQLADFGVSRVLKSAHDPTEVSRETALYLPPEHFDGKTVLQSDLWSVGVICQQLLTGSFPYNNSAKISLISSILMDLPKPLPPDVPQKWQGFIAKCLEKDTARRFKSVAEMRNYLKTTPSQKKPINVPVNAPKTAPAKNIPPKPRPKVPEVRMGAEKNRSLLILGGVLGLVGLVLLAAIIFVSFNTVSKDSVSNTNKVNKIDDEKLRAALKKIDVELDSTSGRVNPDTGKMMFAIRLKNVDAQFFNDVKDEVKVKLDNNLINIISTEPIPTGFLVKVEASLSQEKYNEFITGKTQNIDIQALLNSNGDLIERVLKTTFTKTNQSTPDGWKVAFGYQPGNTTTVKSTKPDDKQNTVKNDQESNNITDDKDTVSDGSRKTSSSDTGTIRFPSKDEN
jgi:serine/threonine protein kinase